MSKQKKYNGYLRKSFTFNGKRVYVYGKTAKELSENEMKKREELKSEEQNISNPTLDSYYEYFTKIRRREIKESTLRSQRIQYQLISSVRLEPSTRFGDLRIQEITRRNIEDARQILLEEGKTPQYLNNCFAHLNHVFNNAVLDETIPKNPCRALSQLKRNAPLIGENRHRALTEEETKFFFEAAKARNSHYYNHFLIMVKTGMRLGEITGLYRTDVDFKNGFIHVRRTVIRDEVGAYVIGDDAKTESGHRDIPLTKDVAEIIRDQDKRNAQTANTETAGLLFLSSEGKVLRDYTINREIKRICKDAEIPVFTCHAFRNTFATRFIEQRPQDYKILSEILGHKDISITLNLYTHVMTENKVKAMKEVSIKTS